MSDSLKAEDLLKELFERTLLDLVGGWDGGGVLRGTSFYGRK